MAYIAEISDLKKYYGNRLVLDIPRLTFAPARRYALIGTNGSGKTTLLRILAGILPPDEGEVIINSPTSGYMPQKPYAFNYSVLKNVSMAVKNDPQKEKTALAALEKVGLEHMAANRGNSLSGGETQRMAFARILAQENKLILLDEPTAAADIAAEKMLTAALGEHLENTGATLIFSTHTPALALDLADEIIFMEKGRALESGPAKDLMYSPKTAEASQFLAHWRI